MGQTQERGAAASPPLDVTVPRRAPGLPPLPYDTIDVEVEEKAQPANPS